jgi:hypothetical protein
MSQSKRMLDELNTPPVERITPNPVCKACRGYGWVSGDLVPYGDDMVRTPSEPCACVTEQVRDDDAEIEIVEPDDGPGLDTEIWPDYDEPSELDDPEL